MLYSTRFPLNALQNVFPTECFTKRVQVFGSRGMTPFSAMDSQEYAGDPRQPPERDQTAFFRFLLCTGALLNPVVCRTS